MQTTAERLAITQASIDQSAKLGPAINAPVSTLERTVMELRAERDELLEVLGEIEQRASADSNLYRSVGKASIATALNFIADKASAAIARYKL